MMRLSKGQVSVELLIIVGFIALVMIPVLFSVYIRSGEYQQRIYASQVNIAAGRLAQAVDSVGFLGGNAKLVLEVQIPQGVNASASGKEIVFSFDDNGQRNDISKVTRFDMLESNFGRLASPGTYFVEVKALGGKVGLDVQNGTAAP